MGVILGSDDLKGDEALEALSKRGGSACECRCTLLHLSSGSSGSDRRVQRVLKSAQDSPAAPHTRRAPARR